MVDKSAARVRQMFGEIAGSYDFLNHLLSMNVDRYWRWRAVRETPPTGEGPILDLCTGTGDLALAYRRAAPRNVAVLGADFCHPMLTLARGKGARIGDEAGPITFIEADAQQLPLSDDTYQIVSVAFGLRNVADTDRGLAEMARVCRPGGRVVVLEFSRPTLPGLRGLYSLYFRHVLPRVGQALARNAQSAYQYLPESVGEFPQGEELLAKLRGAGLRNTRWIPLTCGIASLYIGQK